MSIQHDRIDEPLGRAEAEDEVGGIFAADEALGCLGDVESVGEAFEIGEGGFELELISEYEG